MSYPTPEEIRASILRTVPLGVSAGDVLANGMLDEFWRGRFGVGIRRNELCSDERRVCADDVVEVVAVAQSAPSEENDEWCKGVFRLKSGEYAYVQSEQCETCGSGQTLMNVRRTLSALLALGMTAYDREVLGLSLPS